MKKISTIGILSPEGLFFNCTEAKLNALIKQKEKVQGIMFTREGLRNYDYVGLSDITRSQIFWLIKYKSQVMNEIQFDQIESILERLGE